jgi:hypothetical protein
MEDFAVDLADPRSVRETIERGLIGVGSYITPWLRARPSDVVHLAPGSPSGAGATFHFSIEVETPGAASQIVLRERADGPCSYRPTQDPASLVDGWTQGRPVLLDVNLGYFDLLPKRQRDPLASPCSTTDLIDGLRPLAPSIAAVTLAYAPGSCPSERWAPLAAELRLALLAMLESSRSAEEASS